MVSPRRFKVFSYHWLSGYFTDTYSQLLVWIPGCMRSSESRLCWGADEGETLSVVYSAECKAIQKAERSTGMLPVLIVLFVFSYVILTALVVEQGRTIEAQRGLIREMLNDSNQLAALKAKMARSENTHPRQSPADAGHAPSVGQKKIPAGTPKSGSVGKLKNKASHPMKQAPGRPPSDLEDVRRSTRAI